MINIKKKETSDRSLWKDASFYETSRIRLASAPCIYRCEV